MGNRKNQNNAYIGRDVNNSVIQVGDHPTTNIHAEIDNTELGQSIGEVLSDTDRRARWEEYHRESYRRNSREILEPMFVSGVCGLSLGAIWKLVTPWETVVVLPVAILIALAFSIFHITQLGVRQNLTLSMLVLLQFMLLLNFTAIENWMYINSIVGTLLLGTVGIFIGLTSGIVMLFWKPFGD